LQAVCVARAQPPSSFNFNPLIVPSSRSIDNSMQRVVSELLGCWDESAVQIEAIATEKASWTEPLAISASTSSELTSGANLALLAPAFVEQRSPTNRTVLMIAATALLMAGLSTVIAVTGGFRNRAKIEASNSTAAPAPQNVVEPLASVPQNQPRKGSRIQTGPARERTPGPGIEQTTAQDTGATANRTHENAVSDQANHALEARNKSVSDVREKKDKATTEAQSIDVVMQIENGRVLKAAIAGHKPGMDSYEAMALRIARQRRYASKGTSQETVRITVTQPN